jgi:hypothetical protein
MDSFKIVSIKTKKTTIDQVLDFEKKMGYCFPSDYKTFLLKYKGEVFLDTNYLLVNLKNRKDKVAIFRLDTLQSLSQSWDYLKGYEELKGIIPIGDTLGGGQFWGLGVNQKNYNKVYLINPDFSKIEVANSFSSFLLKIVFV